MTLQAPNPDESVSSPPIEGSDEDYIYLITVKRFGNRWAIHIFTNKGLKYFITMRKTKDHAVHVAIGMGLAIGLGNKMLGLPLELQIYNWFGKLKGKGSKQSYGHDSPKIEG